MNDYNPLKLRRRALRAKPYKIQPPVKQGFDGKVIPSNSKDRVKYWLVTLSARATGARKQRFFFDTEREALDWVRLKQAEITQRGLDAFAMPDEVRGELWPPTGRAKKRGHRTLSEIIGSERGSADECVGAPPKKAADLVKSSK